ncbi:YbaB/EbfC family nucleoid-associated protein [Nocardia sp. NPDC006044]|uniref:YbaB/EbfC family nucleoid-associated protein n=1 Tax=Nocardia sp. NPDC006044 TaxID=3364306 RepID=UPI0036C72ADA
MAHDFSRGDVAGLMEEVQSQLHSIARLQQQRLALMGKATVRGGRVTVVVNADGNVIETKFGRGVEDLEYAELARAVTQAAQEATADVRRQSQELLAPFQEERARLPKLSDLVEGMPDLSSQMPAQTHASLSKPDSLERATAAGTDSAAMAFDNVESLDNVKSRERGVTDSGW